MVRTDPVKILVIGAGDRGNIYTRILKTLDFIEIAGVCEPNEARMTKFVSELNDMRKTVKQYSDWKESIVDADLYDAVLICVLDHMHREITIKFANLGKHILVEKPLSTTWEGCKEMIDAIEKNNVLFAVGHVLRYSPHNLKLKQLVDDAVIGDIINLNHTEPVGWWHFAHSFVRGNWRRSDTSSFSLMTKCCHDIDALMWILGWKNLKRVTSFGSLSYFRKEHKPKGAGSRCLDCAVEETCPYSAKKIYLDALLENKPTNMCRVLTDVEDVPHVIKALEEGPYGRCVFECDNDVCDHQVVSLDFGNKTATMTMIAMSKDVCVRKMCLYGTKGEISTDSTTIRIFDYNTQKTTTIKPNEDPISGHGGGDSGLAKAFAYGLKEVVMKGMSVKEAQEKYIKCTPEDAAMGHKVVFLAEQSRLEGGAVMTLESDIYL